MGNRDNPIERTTNGWRIVSTLLFLAVAAAISLHCYRYSMFEIDTLGYAGTVALADTNDVVKTHNIVYSAPLTPHLRGLDEESKQALDLRRRAADPYYAALLFPYFAIKPLYILTLEAAHKLGFSAVDSTRAVAALFYFAIAVMLWTYTRSWLAFIILILPETMLLGQANEPDGMSCFLLLLGLWMAFVRRSDMGLLPLLLAIWVRPENSLLSVLVIVVFLFQARLDWKKAAVLVLLTAGSELVISHYGYTVRGIYSHFLGGAPGGDSFAFSNFVRALGTAAVESLHSTAPLFGLLWLVCFPLVKNDFRWIMAVTLVFTAVRFMLFPMYQLRYYGLFFITTAMAAVLVIQDVVYQDLEIPNLRDLTSRLFRKAA